MLKLLIFAFISVCGIIFIFLGCSLLSGSDEFVCYFYVFSCFSLLLYSFLGISYRFLVQSLFKADADIDEIYLKLANDRDKEALQRKTFYGYLLLIISIMILSYGIVGQVWGLLLLASFFVITSVYFIFDTLWQKCLESTILHMKSPLPEEVLNIQKVIEVRRRETPFLDAKLAASETIRLTQKILREEEGTIRMESMLSALGALGGYMCQRALFINFLETKDIRSNEVKKVQNSNGCSFFVGEPLNDFLIYSSHSLWELTLSNIPLKDNLVDLDELLAHVNATMDGDEFGLPRIPKRAHAPHLPVEYVKMMWPDVFSIMPLLCQTPQEWVIAIGLAIQMVIDEYKNDLKLDVALLIVMESAVPMSRVDLLDYFSGKVNSG